MTKCNTLQHTATHCKTLNIQYHAATNTHSSPPKNGEIALWQNTRVVKWGARQRGARPRVIRAGPNEGAKLGPQYQGFTRLFHKPGGYQIFLTYLGFIGFSSKYQGFTGFFTQYRGFIFDKLCPISDFFKRKRWRRPSSNITKKQRKKKRIGDP